ncbi:MAG TPA: PAS domain S-box protein [Candidatus Binatia bacterium]|jgi:PAS domain S-box-containing protein
MTAALLLLSALCQIAVAFLALNAPRSPRTRVAWWLLAAALLLLAAALLLMAARRLVALGGILYGADAGHIRLLEETFATTTSVLLLLGIIGMRRLWTDADTAMRQSSEREGALQESETLWQRVFEYAPDGYIMLSLEGRLERMNRAAAEIAGLTRESAEGRHIFESGLFDDEGMAQAARNLGLMQQGVDPGPAEYTFHRPDGSERQVEVIGYLIELGGRPLMLTIVHDVTRRRRSEAELRLSQLRLEEAQRAAGVVSFEIDLRDATMWVSNDMRAGAAAGDGRRQISLEEGFSFIIAEDRERVAQEMALATQRGGTGEIVVEYRQANLATGQVAVVRSTARPELDEDGNVFRLIGATVDLTEIRRAEQEIRTLNAALEERVRARTAELERAVDELEAFSYSVSHDLRSPLRAMAGYSELVLEEDGAALGPASRDHLERIRASSVRMAGLIDGLLSLSRLARATRNETEVDLSEIARGVVADLRNSDPSREVEIVIREDLEAVADAGMMSLLVQNLLANAWKFTRTCRQARIELGADGNGSFFVRDNGVGFDASQKSKLFRPFERLHRTDEFEGTGIGLATVGRIVRHHGGKVWAEGSVGKGSTFWFTLGPAAGAAQKSGA